MHRRSLISFALVVALSACANLHLSRHADPSPEPTGTIAIGGALSTPPVPVPTVAKPTPRPGTIAITVLDRATGAPRSDIRVRLTPRSGGSPFVIVSDASGIARAVVPAGRYDADVLTGCQPDVIVTYGSKADLGVPEGDRVSGTMNVQATRRFGAGPPVRFTRKLPWPRNEDITLEYELYDRCETVEAPNRSVPYLRYRTGGPLALVDGPLRSDASSRVTIVIRCTGAGDPSLYLYDPQNPSDSADILTIRPLEPDQHRCA